ncbi:MAG TPA: BON domain-containing protein, partial [Isosphaeraceae bacterium]|nr:BON domain-containing protein [Isosphaeraceae bacterium]
MLVGLKRISTALGLVAGLAAGAHAQGVAPSANQATANAVAGALQSSPSLSGYRIEVESREGLVTLSGTVKTRAQKAEALALAERVGGVRGVVDHLKLSRADRLRRVQYQP